MPATAQVTLAAASGSAVTGNLKLTASPGGVVMVGEIQGLTPGAHGFHLHEFGDCSAPDLKSAGEHLNPDKTEHGGGPTSTSRHLGDISNLMADAAGHAAVDSIIADSTLRDGGPKDLFGKAVIVHAMPDDYQSQPAGNSGARIACGVVK